MATPVTKRFPESLKQRLIASAKAKNTPLWLMAENSKRKAQQRRWTEKGANFPVGQKQIHLYVQDIARSMTEVRELTPKTAQHSQSHSIERRISLPNGPTLQSPCPLTNSTFATTCGICTACAFSLFDHMSFHQASLKSQIQSQASGAPIVP